MKAVLMVGLLFAGLVGSCDKDVNVEEKTEGKTLGFSNEDYARFAQQTKDGGFIAAGYTNSIRGNYDIFVAKTNRNFTLEWSKTFGNNSPDEGNKIIQTFDGGYVVVGTVAVSSGNQDLFVAKMDPKGNVLWSRHFGGSLREEGRSVVQLEDRGLLILGSTMSFGAGDMDVYVIKTDEYGRPRWIKTYGGFSGDYGYDLAATPDGGAIVTGATYNFGATKQDAFLLKIDAAGQQQWFTIYDDQVYQARNEGRAVAVTPDGGYVLAGLTNNGPPFPVYDIFIVKTDQNGNRLWSSNLDFSTSDEGYGIQISRDNQILVAGKSYLNAVAGDYGMILAKVSLSDGSLIWARNYGGPRDEIAYSVQPATRGYLVTGFTQSYGKGKADMYFVEVDENGDPQ